ncbi:MAG: hypothetical protein NDJ89_02520 [Oligoflexia bacterium]|nr:hypothetical protein [Oligoflexia bacterium]
MEFHKKRISSLLLENQVIRSVNYSSGFQERELQTGVSPGGLLENHPQGTIMYPEYLIDIFVDSETHF